MVIPSLIQHKRDGHPLKPEEWARLVADYTAGRVPDYQMSALLMAVFFRGLTPEELAALTDAMIASGDRLDFDGFQLPLVDKHSTGGVGDKVSLLLAPMVASCGVAVPMMSGRGLGHTGGTLDKLEAIPGFRTNLSLRETQSQVERIGCAMIGQTPEIAPADKRLYALRDVTGTVESIPLISASIMSKKLAEGLDGLVLDVKTGSGAFMPEPERAIELARTMIGLGEARGCPTVALITAMDRPLGRACGHTLEVEEAIEGLSGTGPEDLMEVTYALGVEMLLLAGVARDRAEALGRLQDSVASGRALDTFARVIEAQGGNPEIVRDPAGLPQAGAVEVYRAPRTGSVAAVHPRRIGLAILELGGGRRTIEDEIDPAVGFVITVKPGDRVREGEPIASIFARDGQGIALGTRALSEAVVIGDAGQLTPLITHRITGQGVEMLAGAGAD
ncbi:MAG: thymidine phosphorylase [Gemmatimonadales bacterium]|nr:thymidine phosphorylase [Gemmatimonadales bacterium]MBA3555826.1 thymidine phosphorylase [Gemmatimonadales bacterium]